MSLLPNCALCGRFVGWKKSSVSWTPFGTSNDTEPPDMEYAHLLCWQSPSNRSLVKLIKSTSWLKPIVSRV